MRLADDTKVTDLCWIGEVSFASVFVLSLCEGSSMCMLPTSCLSRKWHIFFLTIFRVLYTKIEKMDLSSLQNWSARVSLISPPRDGSIRTIRRSPTKFRISAGFGFGFRPDSDSEFGRIRIRSSAGFGFRVRPDIYIYDPVYIWTS